MPATFRSVTLRIPSGTALSTQYQQSDGTYGGDGFFLNGAIPVGLTLPSAWTAAALTVQTSGDNSTWNDVYDRFGTEVTIQAAASRRVVLEPSLLGGALYIRFRSGTSGAPVNQAANRDIVLTFRDYE